MTLEATTRRSLTGKQKAMLAAPPVLVVTMYIAFRQLTAQLGFPLGYLVAFSLYWVVWCLALPIAVLAARGERSGFSWRLAVARNDDSA